MYLEVTLQKHIIFVDFTLFFFVNSNPVYLVTLSIFIFFSEQNIFINYYLNLKISNQKIVKIEMFNYY